MRKKLENIKVSFTNIQKVSQQKRKSEENEEKQYLSEAIKNLGSATNLKRLFEK